MPTTAADTYNVTVPANVDLTTNTVKVGVNYLFGTSGGPLVTSALTVATTTKPREFPGAFFMRE